MAANMLTSQFAFHDSQRSDRKVDVLLYYPDKLPNTPVPLVVFAHCLMGAGNWYEYLGKALAEEGYAMASIESHDYLPATSNWLATDQAFVLDELRRQSREVPDFPLFGKLEGGKAAAAGHSLGGAASYYSVNKESGPLGGHYSADFDTILTMSACCGWDDSPIQAGVCEGKPAPTDALSMTRIPSLQLTGTKDCLCPPSHVAEPFYNALATDCKYLVEITGATHCHFAAMPGVIGWVADPICDALEKGFCALSPSPDERISFETQEETATKYAMAWFDWTLRGKSPAAFDAMVRSDAAQGSAVLQAGTAGCPASSSTVV